MTKSDVRDPTTSDAARESIDQHCAPTRLPTSFNRETGGLYVRFAEPDADAGCDSMLLNDELDVWVNRNATTRELTSIFFGAFADATAHEELVKISKQAEEDVESWVRWWQVAKALSAIPRDEIIQGQFIDGRLPLEILRDLLGFEVTGEDVSRDDIGRTAGQIYLYLKQKKDVLIDRLVDDLRLPRDQVLLGVGWLLKEGKVGLDPCHGSFRVKFSD